MYVYVYIYEYNDHANPQIGQKQQGTYINLSCTTQDSACDSFSLCMKGVSLTSFLGEIPTSLRDIALCCGSKL